MNYCSHCAAPLQVIVPADDNCPRHVCTSCSKIHYQNPQLVVGCVPVWQKKILLCRRNIEPAVGLWTLPAGYLELGETASAGAARETLEETGAVATDLQPYLFYDIVHIGQIYFMFLASLTRPHFHATAESLEVRLFNEEEVPWDRIAFPVIRKVLGQYFDDARNESFSFRVGEVTERMGGG